MAVVHTTKCSLSTTFPVEGGQNVKMSAQLFPTCITSGCNTRHMDVSKIIEVIFKI